MKYCQKCGKQLVDEAVVCTGCGCSVAPFWKRGFSLQKLDLHMTKKLLCVAEAVVLIFAFLILCSGSFWEGRKELDYTHNLSDEEELQNAIYNMKNQYPGLREGFFEEDFFVLFQAFENDPTVFFAVLFLIFLVANFVLCFLRIVNIHGMEKWGWSVFSVGGAISFVITFILAIVQFHKDLGFGIYSGVYYFQSFVRWSFDPTGLCYFVIFLLLLAVALDISAKVLHRKAKRQVEDAEENKTL